MPIPVNNRFNVQSHIDTIETDQSNVLKNNNDENVEQNICRNTGSHKTKHTGEVLKKRLDEFKENKQVRYCKNHVFPTEKQFGKAITKENIEMK